VSPDVQLGEEAAKIARRRHARVFPVPVDSIIRAHGIRIESIPLSDDLSGMSFVRSGVSAIVVNATHHINRRRFTLAHELGHHILHASYLNNNVHVDKLVLNRDKVSSRGEDQKEIQANAFAAELLMPRVEMSKLLNIDINDEDAIYVQARRFRVSTSALIYRIINVIDDL
jgi:Zn-dependent peptidase ImmA (M78 family)